MYYNFSQDIVPGKKGEVLASKLLSKYGTFEIMDGYFPDYDLKGPFTVEVKTDIFSPNSGNVAIEYQHRDGKLSGISVTKADKYFIIAHDKTYSAVKDGLRQDGWWLGFLIPTNTLKDLLKDRIWYKRILGGDNKNTKMILVPIKDLYEHTEEFILIK